MNIDWQEIKKKYPNIKEKFDMYFDYEKLDCDYCYCDIEKFFDDNEIIILPLYYLSRNPHDESWYDDWGFEIITKNGIKIRIMNLKSRNESKLEAVKKAFEILEKKLKDKI